MNPANSGIARIVWTQAWQVTAVILLVIVLTRLFARNRPHLAHGLWVLVKCITPPVWSSPSGLFCWLQTGSAAATEDAPRIASAELSTDMWAEIETADPVAVLPDTRILEFTANEQNGHAFVSDGGAVWTVTLAHPGLVNRMKQNPEPSDHADAGLVKAGNPHLRRVIIQAAQRLVNYGTRWGGFAIRKVREGKPRNVAAAAVANRWTRKLYHQIQPEQLAAA